jgi:hypothetical protein
VLVAGVVVAALHPASSALLDTDFGEGDPAPWTPVSGEWEVVEGAYRGTTQRGDSLALAGGGWGEVALEAFARAERLEGDDARAGLLFRYAGECAHYGLEFAPGAGRGAELFVVRECARSRLASAALPLDSGWHKYRVVVTDFGAGVNITVSRDDAVVLRYADPNPAASASGRVGLFAAGPPGSAAVHFDNVVARFPEPSFLGVLAYFATRLLEDWTDDFEWKSPKPLDSPRSYSAPPHRPADPATPGYGGMLDLVPLLPGWSADPSLRLAPILQFAVILGGLLLLAQPRLQRAPRFPLSGPGFAFLREFPEPAPWISLAAGLVALGGLVPPLLPPACAGASAVVLWRALRP